ncbi:Male-specific lethal 1-like 1 [Triplophysa tibetana]|uniref:Male-specific lethal 1-like 1 n=1 Tax=Triplophysa tibetana TaxID=1572043 RepID=A0A5A9NC38_9TELE|nr:Male-specific lethal 1-like 1 [Triplophysa tibetana]
MTMRSTVFTSEGHRLDASLSTIHNSANHQHIRKAKISHKSASPFPDPSSAGGHTQEENWETLGFLTFPSTKQMGAEGSPVKSKSLFCPANQNHVEKMDPMASNGSSQRRDGGAVPSPENSPDGKRWNVRKGSGLVDTQTSCIRQILLLQLELIEQQQKQLHNKNKEIDDLKDEKNMLMARIERMEHRLQTVRKDGDSRPSQTPRRKEPEAKTASSNEGQQEKQVDSPKQASCDRAGRDTKRRLLFQDSRKGRTRRGQAKSPPPPSPPPQEGLCPKEEPQDVSCSGSQEQPYMTTTETCCCHQPPPSPWGDSSPVHEDTVPVPSWRESIIEPLGQKEASDIPECLDDSVFLKRHSKLELDEKRRKRWDIQRIREQRMFQRLQQRMNKRKVVQDSEQERCSLHPNLEDVKSIMVTPFLPTVACGKPLANLKEENFELPLVEERSHCRSEVIKKRTPHRRCRK